ncbi:MAG: DUF4272 domain-containing protein, partial [Niastella sp.]|nr:DUF4272 domain-containing protein [Niastella sp.]
MQIFTLYFHTPDYDGIMARVKQAFPKATLGPFQENGSRGMLVELKSGFLSRKESLKVSYREREKPSYHLRDANCPVGQQLRGMHNYVASLPAGDAKLQSLLLNKIETINAELSLMATPKLTEDFRTLLFELAQTYDAFIFAQAAASISKSPVQHFLDKEGNLILDIQGHTGNGKVNVTINAQYFDDQQPASPEQQERKKRSEDFLTEHAILINTHLPFVDAQDSARVRNKQDIIERVYALTLLAAKGEGVPTEHLEKVKTDLSINGLSPEEARIYAAPELTDQQKANATWRYESLQVLLWALGLVETLPYPSDICDVSTLVGLVIRQPREAFTSKAVVRSTPEILD